MSRSSIDANIGMTVLKSTHSRHSNLEALADGALLQGMDVREAVRAIGPFVLVHQIGRGGFAPVWLARETYGDAELRTVALKLFSLDPQTEASRNRHTRLVIDEARALCRVEHPNVVRFYSIVVDQAQATMGLAMEYLDGTPLDRKLKEAGRLSMGETVKIGLAVASALAAVHRRGVVHRDVKPANIVETDSTYKLIDFGIALGAPMPKPIAEVLEVDDVPLSESA
jgi:serine/threonine protein kinase